MYASLLPLVVGELESDYRHRDGESLTIIANYARKLNLPRS